MQIKYLICIFIKNPTMGVTINNRATALERTVVKARGGGLKYINTFYWYQIDSAVVEAQKCYVRMEDSLQLQCIIIEKQYNQINALWCNRKGLTTHR